MEREEINKTVKEIINRSLLKPVEIKLEDRLTEDLGLDSIGYIELSTGLEKAYSVDISDEDIEGFSTVQEVVDAVLVAPTFAAEEE